MLTGRRAFEGSSQASLVAAILSSEPGSMSRATPGIPRFLEWLVENCLRKDREDRWQRLHDVKLELERFASEDAPDERVASAAHRVHQRTRFAWSVAAIAALATLASTALLLRERPAAEPLYRLSVLPPESGTLATTGDSPSISPDGRHVVFVATDASTKMRLWIRSLDELDARELPGTDGAAFPTWSPDSRHIAFFADGRLKRIETSEGTPRTLAPAPNGRGVAWSADGETIVFAPDIGGSLLRVPALGGEVAQATVADVSRNESSHRFPHFLPDGRRFLFVIEGSPDVAGGLCGVTQLRRARSR